MYTCAKCGVHACRTGEKDRLPKNCPIRREELLEEAMEEYGKTPVKEFYITASAMEALGYCQWVRLKETVELCLRMNYKKIGLAFCSGLSREAKVVASVLESHGLEVVSVICKSGGLDKTKAGLEETQKIHPGEFEPMCNPVFQAKLLNEQKTEFNIALGLCVGHDSLFYRYSDAMVTTLVAKDRVLAHNPVGAIYCAEGYYKDKL
ncbi:MAG TPA: DUF1847 domain-containing protein [Candidatus Lachnoclostridium pullistercoris]|uniref:DUF1847 domain-containing protein n=1 Tax=Candidatus Lachnoclostridium pullistercoris TaxID=2838632 RepID=A0A9D2PAI7_9FIRM|nr:DUF1847 domain-containing protein [Candidatus Lachnoclostridium pullistercoris]